jgi:hypothetical protein
LKEGVNLKDLGVDGNILFKKSCKEYVGKAWTELMWPGYRSIAGCCEHGDELSGYI